MFAVNRRCPLGVEIERETICYGSENPQSKKYTLCHCLY